MGLRKKRVADRGLTWEQAVPEALCFGWIDSGAARRRRRGAPAVDPAQADQRV